MKLSEGLIYVPRNENEVTIVNVQPERHNDEGKVIYSGYVRYINHVGAECVKTVNQFTTDYKDK
jgi:hypothetical protein